MFEDLFNHREISEFLSFFPKEKWNKCLYLAVIYGIRCIKQEITIPKISSIEKLLSVPGKSEKNLHYPSKKFEKIDSQARPKTSVHDLNAISREVYKRNSSPPVHHYKQIEKKPYNVPKYLKNIQSKIKSEVQKDLALHLHRKEMASSPVNKREITDYTKDKKNIMNKPNLRLSNSPKKFEENNSPFFYKKFDKNLPDLLEVKEPNTFPIEKLEKDKKSRMAEMAERFLSNPYANVLSP